ncbi:hypothetical protein ACQW5G_03590 [Fructilactobacillus sp. Tb1]|uniref:hypothetical protein n=1 Tax=Fructilactobacillus sp. Tb1 TaxID=3422304 RepID=UPI003D2AF40F
MNIFKKNRNFRVAIYASMINILGTTLFNIVFIIYASKMPNPALAVSCVSIIEAIPYVTDIITGYLADHTRNQYDSILRVRLLQIALFLLLSFLVGLHANWIIFGILLVINYVSSCLSSYSGLLFLPMFKHLVPENELADARGFQAGISGSIYLLGGMIGASSLALLNNNFVFFGLFNTATFLVAYLIFKLNRKAFNYHVENKANSKSETEKTNFIAELKQNLKNLNKYPQLFHFVFIFMIQTFIDSSIQVLIALSALHDKSLIISNYGFTIAIFGASLTAGTIIGSFLPLKQLKKMSLELNCIFECSSLFLVILNMNTLKNSYLLLLLTFIEGYFFGISNPKLDAFIMKVIPEKSLGTIISSFSAIICIPLPLGSVFAGTIGNIANGKLAWFILLLIAAVGLFYSVKLKLKYTSIA